MKMKKILNFRPFVLFALCLMLGTLLATYVFASSNLKLIYFLFLSVIALSFITLTIIFKKKVLAIIAVCVLLFSAPFGLLHFKQKKFEYNLKFDEQKLVIKGRICEHYDFSSSGNLSLMLDSVTVVGANFSEDLYGKIAVYVSPENFNLKDFELGRFITIFGKLRVNDFKTGEKFALYNMSSNIIGSCFSDYSNFEFQNNKNTSFDESVRTIVYNKLTDFDLKYANLGYAMFFGDDTLVEDDIILSFRTTGIAHLIAVSGLHISIIIAMLGFVLRLLKVSDKTKFVIFVVVFAFYSYLCNFAVSVLRACLMALVLLYMKIRGRCYDGLSSMAFSIIPILLINPLNMFKVSFILSYMAVFSIIIFTKTLVVVFDKVFHKNLSNSLALNVSVQAGLLFVQLYFFKNYSPLSIMCNLLSIPISSIAFMILIAGFLISCIFPFMSFLCYGFDGLMNLVVKFNYTISKTGISLTMNNLNFWVIILGAASMLILSDFIFVKNRYKAVAVSTLTIIAGILLFVWL